MSEARRKIAEFEDEIERKKQIKAQNRPKSDLVAPTTVTLDLGSFNRRISNPLKPILK